MGFFVLASETSQKKCYSENAMMTCLEQRNPRISKLRIHVIHPIIHQSQGLIDLPSMQTFVIYLIHLKQVQLLLHLWTQFKSYMETQGLL